MFKLSISTPIGRMALAVCVASAVALGVAASSGANDLEREVQAAPTQSYTLANSVSVAVRIKGNVCSVHAWPDFEPKCQFDLREPAGEARTIRMIALR